MLALLQNAVVIRELENCNFFHDTIYYLGLVIRLRSLEIAIFTTDEIKGLKFATNLTELLSLCMFFWRFVPSLARIARLLNYRLKMSQQKDFGQPRDKQAAAMKELQVVLI